MKIAITGAGGLIGSHLARYFAPDHEMLPLRHRDLDITDRGEVRKLILGQRPSLVINCATIEVDDCERDPRRAKSIHVQGPQALAQAASEVGADFIHFSTNYVFDGREIGRPPYTIKDEPWPVNVYGREKLAGERAVLEACSRTYLIRTSWVYGEGKQTFIGQVHQDLLAGKRVRAVTDVWASTTYVLDLLARIAEILKLGCYGTYHVVNEGVCSNFEFGLEAGRLVGLSDSQLREQIHGVKEAEAGRLAPRPRYSPMRCLLSEEIGLPSMRRWRSALSHYVQRSE